MDNKMVDNDTVNSIVDKLKHTRLLAAIGLVAMLLGTMLPYIKYSIFGYSIKLSLWKYWEGKIVLVLLIANAIFFFKDYIEKYIPSLLNVTVWRKISELKYQYAMIPVIIAVAFIIYLTIKLDINFGYYNIGFYTLWFGVICIVIYLIINKGKPVIPGENNNVTPKNNFNTAQNTNDMNNRINNSTQNYNNQMNNPMNQNYNNGMNSQINQNYNNGMNNQMNQNYSNEMNNPSYNNGMNNTTNQNYNNETNYNANQYNNNMNYDTNTNSNNQMNYNPNPNNFNNNNNM